MSAIFIVRDQRKRMAALESSEPPTIVWLNQDETYHRMDEIDGENDPEDSDKQRPAYYLPRAPAPELRIDDPDFDLDMFFMGWWIMSARMRNALGLASEEVVCSAANVIGAPGPARLGYAAVEAIHHLDGIDPDRSDIEAFGDPANPNRYWELAIRDNTRPRVALRPGIQAPASLFYMKRTDWLMITEKAAQRVRAAGITNVFFDQPGPVYGSWMFGPP